MAGAPSLGMTTMDLSASDAGGPRASQVLGALPWMEPVASAGRSGAGRGRGSGELSGSGRRVAMGVEEVDVWVPRHEASRGQVYGRLRDRILRQG